MVTTVEISMYPFREDYREPIEDFIRRLRDYERLRVTPGPTSTVIVGEHERVMSCIAEMFRWSYDEHGRSVFVTKFILDYDPD